MERWAIYGKHGRKWVPYFKNNRSYKNKSYATKIMNHLYEYHRLVNRRVDLKVKAVIAECCPTCGAKVIQ